MKSELIEYPIWLPSTVKSMVSDYLLSLQNTIEVFSDEPGSFYYLNAKKQLQNFSRFQSIYTSSHMKDIWSELYAISSEATDELATEFFIFEQAYSHTVETHEIIVEKIVKSKSTLKMLQKVSEAIPVENDSPFDYVSTCMPKGFTNNLSVFIENLKQKINKFELNERSISHYSSYYCPIPKKFKGNLGLRNFFVHKLYLFFQKHYGAPMYSKITTIIFLIFDEALDSNHILKLCKDANKHLSEDYLFKI
ncbi:TPA: hypothetical protein JA361_00095 [Legionella pneumophila]|nr:hypothetical protein [Legionella pneumophila]HAT8181537.1 hypothetical protein [Legionella pneumophila]